MLSPPPSVDTGWVNLSDWVKYRQVDNIVSVYVSVINYSEVAWRDLSEVLPEGARPPYWLRWAVNRSDGKSALFDIYTDGTMKAFSDTAGYSTSSFQVVFMI